MGVAEAEAAVICADEEDRRRTRRTILTAVALLACVFAIYGQTVFFDFVSFDDQDHLQKNPHVVSGLTLDNLIWDFEIHGPRHWHPLTWVSHQVDFAVFGMRAGPHHVVSVILHAAAAIVLFLALQRMTVTWGTAAFAAGAFAVHPLNVESVAWIAERSNVLCGLFWMAALWVYPRYVGRPCWRTYLVVVVFHAAALMSKPLAVTLPCVLLLLDYWPLRRFQTTCPEEVAATEASHPAGRQCHWKKCTALVLEKAPLFALSLGASVMAVLCQKSAEAMAPLTHLSLTARLITSLAGYGWYLEKTVFPARLVCFYPHPAFIDTDVWETLAVPCVVSLSILVLLSALVVRYRHGRPWLLVGWLWFLGVFVPMIGLVQIGAQRQADRYAYIPLIGLFVAAGGKGGRRKILFACLVLAAWGVTAWRQTGVWRDSLSLYSHVVATDDRNHWGQSNLGVELMKKARTREAVTHLRRAVELVPRYPLGHYNLGVALQDLGQTDLAIAQFEISLRQNPQNAPAHELLAIAFSRRGELDRAIAHFQERARMSPDHGPAFYNLGLALARAGRHREAVAALQRAQELQPRSPSTLFALAYALRSAGELVKARAALEFLVTARPDADEAWLMLGQVLRDTGDFDRARRCFQEALRLRPNWQEPLDELHRLSESK